MSWCGCFCGVASDLEEWVEDQVDAAIDIVVDTAEDAVGAVADFLEETWERVEEGVADLGEIVSDVAEAVWDWITETGISIWEWIKETAGDVWEWTTGAMEDAWDWARDTATDYWDRITTIADTLWDVLVTSIEAIKDFVVEDYLPFLADVLWLLVHIDDILVGGIISLGCLIFGNQDEREYDLIEGLFLLDPDALEDRKVAFLSDQNRYVIFSDSHLFIAGDPHDYFRQMGNHILYQIALESYFQTGYTLIENGDIEDLWLREVTLGSVFLNEATDVLGSPFGDFINNEFENNRIRTQAVKIFNDNQDVYQNIRRYYDNGRYIRTLGNHDDAWASEEHLPGLQFVYPDIQVFDYILIGNYANQPLEYGNSPKAIIAHGHQMEVWNTKICRIAAGMWTETFSFNYQERLTGRATTRSDWEPKFNGPGFANKLSESLSSFDEVEFYEMVENDFFYYPFIPKFILGHSHSPRENAEIPGWMSRDEWNFSEYINGGSIGRWEQFIWCATFENGDAKLFGWTYDQNGVPRCYQFKGGYANYLQRI